MGGPDCGARCAIRDTGAPGEGRYHWTVTVFEGTGPAAEGCTGELAEARSRGQRARRVAADPLTLCLFCRRIELPSTPLPLGLAGLDHHRQASPNPTHRRSTKCPGARSGNPKLFPPDGLGIAAGGGIPPMRAGGGIELLWVKPGEFLLVQLIGSRSRPRRPLVVRGRWVTPVGVASVASSTFDLNPGCSWLDDP
jgi:hypothetical protein